MKVVYLSNFFNHHQKPLSDCLHQLTNGNYWFVETCKLPDSKKKLGYQEYSEPYIIRYNDKTKKIIEKLIWEADAVQFGEAPLNLIKKRIEAGKLVLRDDECRYRNVTRFLKWPVYTYNSLTLNKGYLLCASAFAPIDYALSGMRVDKCFKWGYFPEIRVYDDIEDIISKKEYYNVGGRQTVSILWVGRLVALKHPEAAIIVAEKLRNKGYSFKLNIIGIGPKENKIRRLILKKKLEKEIQLLGSMSPDDVRTYMEKADIFLFTSDRNEGWGAVLNESMNSACAVVAGSNIGSVPYLIKNGINGLVFKDRNWEDLFSKVEWLLLHPKERRDIGKQAYLTMRNVWNAENAARNLMALYEALLNKKEPQITEGPCSKAPLQMRRWRGIFRTL